MARRRTSSIQMDHLLNRMEGNHKLAHGNTSRSDVKKLWCQVTDELNRKGSHKTVIEWQKVWQSWVLRVRTKARKINQLIRGTGGGPPADVLSDMEERVLKVTGKGAITGVLNMETALPWVDPTPKLVKQQTMQSPPPTPPPHTSISQPSIPSQQSAPLHTSYIPPLQQPAPPHTSYIPQTLMPLQQPLPPPPPTHTSISQPSIPSQQSAPLETSYIPPLQQPAPHTSYIPQTLMPLQQPLPQPPPPPPHTSYIPLSLIPFQQPAPPLHTSYIQQTVLPLQRAPPHTPCIPQTFVTLQPPPPQHTSPIQSPAPHTSSYIHYNIQSPPQHTSPIQSPPQHTSPIQSPPQHTSPIQSPPQHTSPIQSPLHDIQSPQHTSPIQSPPSHPSPTQRNSNRRSRRARLNRVQFDTSTATRAMEANGRLLREALLSNAQAIRHGLHEIATAILSLGHR